MKAQKALEHIVPHYILNQFIRSGTSIGANCSEAVFAQSKADFITKLHIALKESNENRYWIEVLLQGEYINKRTYASIMNDCVEIQKLLSTIIKRTKENIDKTK